MGQWNLTVIGSGVYHNGDRLPEDVNRMFAKFVEDLKAAGHDIEHASMTFGGRDLVVHSNDVPPSRLAPDQHPWRKPCHVCQRSDRKMASEYDSGLPDDICMPCFTSHA